MSLPLKLAYAVDAYDVKNDIMPRINEQKQLELLLKHVPQRSTQVDETIKEEAGMTVENEGVSVVVPKSNVQK